MQYPSQAEAQDAACAELRISAFSVSPEVPVAGQPTLVRVTVQNVGSCFTPDFVVQWRQDRFAPTGPNENVNGLAAGQSTTVTFPFVFTNPGDFLTIVEIDTENAVFETNEANNLEIFSVLVLPVPPELFVSDITLSSPAVQTTESLITARITNASITAADAFIVQISPGQFAAPLTREVPALAAGASIDVTVPHTYAWPGDVTISAVADSTNNIAEANEFNNSRSETFNIEAAQVDLVIALSVNPAIPVEGEPATLTATVTNQGNVAAGPFTSVVKPEWWGPDLTFEVASLAAGASVSETFDYTYAEDGLYMARATVDTTWAVWESNEFNNNADLVILVEPALPDLVITNVQVAPPPVAGLVTTAAITINNDGNADAGPFLVTWRPTFFGPDRSIQVNGLAEGASTTVSIEHTFTQAGLANGTATVDALWAVEEINELNNSVATDVDVAAAFVDLVLVDFQVLPPNSAEDEPANAVITIRNDGNFPSDSFLVTWKPELFAPDRNAEVAGLQPGETIVVDLFHTYGNPGVLVTTTAMVDSANMIAESDETNNDDTIQVNVLPVGPDLVITNIGLVQPDVPQVGLAQAGATQGLPITVRVEIANIGNRDAGVFELEWNPGVPFELITQGPGTLSTQFVGLGAGQTTFFDFEYEYPASGNFRSVAFVDAFSQVPELREANNRAILNMEVEPGIDLTITEFEVVPAVGDDVVAQSEAIGRITVVNNGFFPARNFTVSWNPDGNDAGFFNPSETIAELLPGQSTTVELSSSYFFVGDYNSAARVDSLDQVIEFNEDNNLASTTVTVLPRMAQVQIVPQSVRITAGVDDGLDFDAEVILVAASLEPGANCTGFSDLIDELGGFLDDLFGIDIDADIPDVVCSNREYSVDTPTTINLNQPVTVNLTDPTPLIVFGALGEEDSPLVGEVLGAFFDFVDFNTVLEGGTRTVQPIEADGLPAVFADLTYQINILSGPPPIFQP